MSEQILTVGFQLYGGGIESKNFSDRISLLDWDIVLVTTNINNSFYLGSELYNGKISLSDNTSFSFVESLNHWKKEIKEAYENGKSIIIFLDDYKELYIATGERTYSGTGKNRQTMRIVSLTNNYIFIPTSIEARNSIGKSMILDHKVQYLKPFFESFGKLSTYKVTFEQKNIFPLIKTKSGNKTVGGIIKYISITRPKNARRPCRVIEEKRRIENTVNETEKKNLEKQFVSKKRVSDHGEVFTASREVNAMLDLVKQETDRIDSRFLEPACGRGNFLAEVLERKLNVVKSRYTNSQIEYERYAVLAVSSIYGVDILHDNVEECRNRLYEIFNKHYTILFKDQCKEECRKSIKYLLAKNIIFGDALGLTNPMTQKPIIFSEWSAFNGNKLKRRDFTFQGLLQHDINEVPLFSDLGENVFIPKPVTEYPLVDFMRLSDAEY